MKVMTILGTRPEIIRLSLIINKLDQLTEHTLVHTGQNYTPELDTIFFQSMGIREPNVRFDSRSETPMGQIARILESSERVLNEVKPDACLILGDTNSGLSAIVAEKMGIPVFHMEAGNRCFDQRVPEEINRKIVDHLSDINMTLTEHARRYLIAEGIRAETVIKTGSSMKEVLNYYRTKIDASDVLNRLGLDNGSFFIVSAHREENIDSEENFNNLLESLNVIAETYKKRVIISTHPRTRKRLESIGASGFNKLIEFMKPLGFFDYVRLQMCAYCAISDSGTITEESSILGFPAITIRQAHERPEGMDEGTLIMAGLESKDVVDAINIVTGQWRDNNNVTRVVDDYDVDNVSQKVVRIIVSYIEYINRTVWKNY